MGKNGDDSFCRLIGMHNVQLTLALTKSQSGI